MDNATNRRLGVSYGMCSSTVGLHSHTKFTQDEPVHPTLSKHLITNKVDTKVETSHFHLVNKPSSISRQIREHDVPDPSKNTKPLVMYIPNEVQNNHSDMSLHLSLHTDSTPYSTIKDSKQEAQSKLRSRIGV